MSQSEGGLGGNLRPGRGTRDTRLVERALRERWPIPKAIRKPLIERLNEIVQDTTSSPREVTSAAKAILTASKINLENIATTIKAREHEDLAKRLRALEERDGRETAIVPRRAQPPQED